jgi:hypothetical protein
VAWQVVERRIAKLRQGVLEPRAGEETVKRRRPSLYVAARLAKERVSKSVEKDRLVKKFSCEAAEYRREGVLRWSETIATKQLSLFHL